VTSAGVDGLSVLPLGSATGATCGTTRSRRGWAAWLNDAAPALMLCSSTPARFPGSLEASVVASQVDEVILTVARGEQRAPGGKIPPRICQLWGARVGRNCVQSRTQ